MRVVFSPTERNSCTVPSSSPPVYRFGPFGVELSTGRLLRRGARVRLRDQSFAILAILLEHPGQVVSRKEFRRRLWSSDTFVDFENGLNTAVARLRAALGDSASRPRYIETIARRGYRFIAPVEACLTEPIPPHDSTARLLVLPFINLTGDQNLDYLASALTDNLITELARVDATRLAVLAHATSRGFASLSPDLRQISDSLKLDFVVEGSLQRSARSFAASVQLIDTRTQSHLWAGHTALPDGLPSEAACMLASTIAVHCGIPASPATRSVALPTSGTLPAVSMYLRGRHLLYQWTPDSIAAARRCFEQALALNPQMALAYDALAELSWYLGFFGFAPPREIFASGMWAALRAVEIDPSLADTHALLGMYRKEFDYDWAEVDREMRLALRLNPHSPVVRFRYALSGLMPHGRLPEAISELQAVLRLDPLNHFVRTWLAQLYCLARQPAAGLEEILLALQLEPQSLIAHAVHGHLLLSLGFFAEAIDALQRSVEISGQSPLILGWLGQAFAMAGQPEEAVRILGRLQALPPSVYVPPSSFAWIHLALGHTEEALSWFERAVDFRDPMIVPVLSYPALDPLRAHPRFCAIVASMNLIPPEAGHAAVDTAAQCALS